MVLPEFVHKTVERELTRYCREKTFPCQDGEVRLHFRIRGESVTLYQERSGAGQQPGLVAKPVARFRFSPELNQWTLHYPGRGDRWCFYLNAGPSLDFGKLLRHLDDDPLHLFWE